MNEEEIKKEDVVKKPTSYIEYKSRIISLSNFPEVIDEARKEYKINILESKKEKWTNNEIPLNLEREYIDALLEIKDFDTAKRVLDRMKISYPGWEMENLLESYEYRFQLIEKTEKLFEFERLKLKQELNQHNLTTVSIIVGVITIFGVASQTLVARTFQEGVNTFFAIVFAIVFLTAVAFLTNNFFYREKK